MQVGLDQFIKLEEDSESEQEREVNKENQGLKKKVRRTRKDSQNRSFSCPCGKAYLSYPALYTHIKTKHDGKCKFLHQKQPKQTSSTIDKQTWDPLKKIKILLTKYFPSQMQPMFSLKSTPQITQYLQQIKTQSQTPSQQPRKPSTSTINNIFYRLYTILKPDLSYEARSYLQQFLYNLKSLINQIKQDQSYCRNKNGYQLPQHFNKLILNKRAPNIEDRPKIQNYWLILAVRLLFAFGSWLKQQRYTKYKTKYNKEMKVQSNQ